MKAKLSLLCTVLALSACGSPQDSGKQEQPGRQPSSKIEADLAQMNNLPSIGDRKTSHFKDFLTVNGRLCTYFVEQTTEVTYAQPSMIEERVTNRVTRDTANSYECPLSHTDYPFSEIKSRPYTEWREIKIRTIQAKVLPENYLRINTWARDAQILSISDTVLKGVFATEVIMDVRGNDGRRYTRKIYYSKDHLFLGAFEWNLLDADTNSVMDYEFVTDISVR